MMARFKLIPIALVMAAAFFSSSSALAGTYHFDCVGGSGCSFVLNAGAITYSATEEPVIACSSQTGSGSVTNGSSFGEMSTTVQGCKMTVFGITIQCQSTGAPSGVISFGKFPIHLIHLEPQRTTPGVLYTLPTTTLTCSSFIKIELTGNGLIGDVTESCNTSSTNFHVDFSATQGVQRWRQITTAGTFFDLRYDTEDDQRWGTVGVTANDVLTWTNLVKLTCT